MKITFDPTNLRSEMVGEHGITKDELRLALPLAKAAVTQFRASVDK